MIAVRDNGNRRLVVPAIVVVERVKFLDLILLVHIWSASRDAGVELHHLLRVDPTELCRS